MKQTILIAALACLLFSCDEKNNSDAKEGIHMTVSDSNSTSKVDIDSNGIEVKSDDGSQSNVHISKDSIDIKSDDGSSSVKMDKQGNMNIKSSDGKEIEVKVKDSKKK